MLAALALAALIGYLERGDVPASRPPESQREPPTGAAEPGRDTGGRRGGGAPSVDEDGATGASVATAFARHARGAEVEGEGTVAKILPDDLRGSRHQRFLLRVEPGPTVLVAHNVDLARRVAPLRVGDVLSFRGEYVWNARGGIIHWTHRDPDGRHRGGWLRRGDETFQ